MSLFNPTPALRPLRPYQERAIASIREAVKAGHRRIVLQIPTGGGKTRIAGELLRGAIAKGTRPMFTCPAITLIDQTLHSFERDGIDSVGVIQANHPRTNPYAQVQLASIHTLVRRALPDIDFCIVDEVHESRDDWQAILDSPDWEKKIVIGLSATPWVKGMGLRWNKLIVGATIRELIEDGYLCPLTAYVPTHDVDRSTLKKQHGEFTEASASDAMSNATIVGDAVKEWKAKWGEGKTFMFCVNREHAKAQMEAFNDAGAPCGYIDALTPMDERTRIFRKLQYGEIALIASVGCLIRGVDEDVRCILDLQPTRSEIRHVQKWGRGLRPADGKERLIGIDSAGNTLSLGLVTDIHHDMLDSRTEKDRSEAYADEKKPPKPRKCELCQAVIPRLARSCPACGMKVQHHHGVREVDGELVEFGLDGEPTKAKQEKSTLSRTEWYGGLLWIARERGHSEGWAAYRYKEKFGNWPNGMAKTPIPAAPEVVRFDHYCRIKYAKSKRTTGKNDGAASGVSVTS